VDKVHTVVLLSALMLGSGVSSGAGAPTTQTAPAELSVPLPEGIRLAGILFVVPKADKAFYIDMRSPGTEEDPRTIKTTTLMLDLKGGKATDLATILPKELAKGEVADIQASPDQTQLLLINHQEAGMTVAVLDLATSAAKTVTQGRIAYGCWAGKQVAISPIQEDETLGKIRLVNPTDGKSTELPVCALVHKYDAVNQRLVTRGDPDNLDKPIGFEELRGKGKTILLDLGGKVQKVVPETGPVAFSPSGRFLAAENLERMPGSRGTSRQTVHDLVKGETRKVVLSGRLLAVLDDGRVVFQENGMAFIGGQPVSDNTIRVADAEGKTARLVSHTKAAAVVGDTLYYVTSGAKPILKSMKLP
jgi:hypothetical protein